MTFQERFRFYLLLIREFLQPQTGGGFLGPEGFKYKPFPVTKPTRFYVGVSHALLDFELITFPAPIPEKKILSAARLEAQRLYQMLKGMSSPVYFSFWPKNPREVIVAGLTEEALRPLRQHQPPQMILAGLFPAWVALWAYLKAQGDPQDGLYYVRTAQSFEGFWLKDGRPQGVMPSSPGTGALFLEHFQGERLEISGVPEEILLEGARLVPKVLREEKFFCFDQFPLRIRPRIKAKIFLLWLLPALIWGGGLWMDSAQKGLHQEIEKVTQALKGLKKRVSEKEAFQKELEEQEKLAEAIEPYLPDQRPPLLEALLVLTESFPQDAWVRRFEFRSPDEIRIWGECGNALKLLEVLSSSPIFKEARFLSTVTRNPRTEREVFSMVLKLNLDFQPDLSLPPNPLFENKEPLDQP